MAVSVILDIEGTICPISFVKDVLFPYFLAQLPDILDRYTYPISQNSTDTLESILAKFPQATLVSKTQLHSHIKSLVDNDVKDPVLKELQGFVWEKGYHEGQIQAPLYNDALQAIGTWSKDPAKNVYIYSSGSVKAQKLLFQYVKPIDSTGPVESQDINSQLSGYFDTNNAGPKIEASSYLKIAHAIGSDPSSCVFLSDNPKEVDAAIAAGMKSYLVVRPGNAPVDSTATKITSFDQLSI